MCSFCATTVLARPSLQSSTTRARRAKCGRVRARFVSAINVVRSASVNTRGAFGRPVRMPVLLVNQTGQSCELFRFLQGQDTRDMTIKRLDHVSVVVDDLAATIAFFTAL